LPAAWAALLITSLVYVAFSNPAERAIALDDARAAVFYFANWHFIGAGQDYFAESIASSPFLHLWSLAVEEQFYLVWPLVSLGLIRSWARRPRGTTTFVVLATVVATWWAASVAADDLLRAYYGTDTRAYQLLAGAAMAFVLSRSDGSSRQVIPRRLSGLMVGVGLVGLAVISMTGGIGAVDRGMAATGATVVMLTAIAGRHPGTGGAAERVLATRPFVVLGGLSYATYLWHWPLVILLERTLVLSPEATLGIVAVGSTAIAKLSMDLLEGPIRRRVRTRDRRSHVAVVAVGLAGTLVVGLVAAPVVLRADIAQVQAVDRPGFVPAPVIVTVPVETEPAQPQASPLDPSPVVVPVREPVTGPVPEDLGAVPFEASFGERAGCVNVVPTGLEQCLVTDGAGLRVLLVGDSHASKLNSALAEHAARNDYAYASATTNGCTWQRGLEYVNALPVEAGKQACRDLRDVLIDDVLPAFDPDLVIAVAHGFTEPSSEVLPRPGWPSTDGLSGTELVRIATAEAIDELTATGAEIVIVEPIPVADFDVAACLSGADTIEQCAFVATAPGYDTDVYRALAIERDDVETIDMSRLACPAYPVCDAVLEGIQVREDRDHLYGGYVVMIADELMALIGI
jgi:peptidoglycan/LPS O-acetylase OafA/YrhL